jgi:hypothetical protein
MFVSMPCFGQRGPRAADRSMKLDRGFVADRAEGDVGQTGLWDPIGMCTERYFDRPREVLRARPAAILSDRNRDSIRP